MTVRGRSARLARGTAELLLLTAFSLVACSESATRDPLETPADAGTVRASTDSAPATPRPDSGVRDTPGPLPDPWGEPADGSVAWPDLRDGGGIEELPDGGIPGWDGFADGGRDDPWLEPTDGGFRELDAGELESCRGNGDCAETEHCFFPRRTACGEASGGLCAPRPTTCSTLSRPVCGCDAHTYTNACSAWLSGTSVRDDGACM